MMCLLKKKNLMTFFLVQLQSRKRRKRKKVAKPKAEKPASILDSKRSQNIGIFIKSTHIDVARMEEVVYNFELSLESEVLTQIQEIQATPDELTQLKLMWRHFQ